MSLLRYGISENKRREMTAERLEHSVLHDRVPTLPRMSERVNF